MTHLPSNFLAYFFSIQTQKNFTFFVIASVIFDAVKITAQLSDLKKTFSKCQDEFKNKVINTKKSKAMNFSFKICFFFCYENRDYKKAMKHQFFIVSLLIMTFWLSMSGI
jgi:hypothetical protein